MIPKQIVEQVTETAKDNIVSVIGEYVQLKKKGSAYMGCCPFHNEKTPRSVYRRPRDSSSASAAARAAVP